MTIQVSATKALSKNLGVYGADDSLSANNGANVLIVCYLFNDVADCGADFSNCVIAVLAAACCQQTLALMSRYRSRLTLRGVVGIG